MSTCVAFCRKDRSRLGVDRLYDNKDTGHKLLVLGFGEGRVGFRFDRLVVFDYNPTDREVVNWVSEIILGLSPHGHFFCLPNGETVEDVIADYRALNQV